VLDRTPPPATLIAHTPTRISDWLWPTCFLAGSCFRLEGLDACRNFWHISVVIFVVSSWLSGYSRRRTFCVALTTMLGHCHRIHLINTAAEHGRSITIIGSLRMHSTSLLCYATTFEGQKLIKSLDKDSKSQCDSWRPMRCIFIPGASDCLEVDRGSALPGYR
jgi:hypothetical protein